MSDLRTKLLGWSYQFEEWITDRYEGWPEPLQGWWNEVDDGVFARHVCSVFGHEPGKDQCGLPEHDCCEWCHELLPFQAGDVPGRMLGRLHWYLDDPELSARITEKLGETGLARRGSGH